MALRSLDSIFTSSSQLLLLLPVAGCILLVLVSVAFAEAQCNSYMVKLDSRLARISDLLQLSQPPYPNRFLQNIYLPMVVTLPAMPVIGLVLAITAPWLFLILLLNLIACGIIVARYNGLIRKQGSSLAWPIEDSVEASIGGSSTSSPQIGEQGTPITIPSYLLRNRYHDLGSSRTLEDEELSAGRLLAPVEDRLARRKRQDLSTVRTIYHGLILGGSAVLALLQLSSLGSIVGFFIISSSFRRGFLSLCEYIFPRHERISLDQAYRFLSISLLAPAAVEAQLEERHKSTIESLERFNQRYGPLVQTKRMMRLRNISLTHAHHGLQIDKITCRLELSPATLIRITNPRLAQELRVLIRQVESMRYQDWHLDGDFFCGGQKLSLAFLSQLPCRAPWKIRVASPKIEASFSPEQQEQVLEMIRSYGLDHLIYGEDGFVADLTSLTRRQQQRLRSLISLLILILEPSCLSVAPFILEPFDADEIKKLTEMLRIESKHLACSTLFLTRRPLAGLQDNPCYELSRTSLSKLTP